MHVIVITRRANDFHAQLQGEPSKWAASSYSVDEAVGKLVDSHGHELGIQIQWNIHDQTTRDYAKEDPAGKKTFDGRSAY